MTGNRRAMGIMTYVGRNAAGLRPTEVSYVRHNPRTFLTNFANLFCYPDMGESPGRLCTQDARLTARLAYVTKQHL